MSIPTPFPSNRAEAARFYRDELGWAIHPLYGPHKGPERVRGKKPELKGWRDWRADQLSDELIEKYFGEFGSSNLGCVVRAPHICIDLDSKPDKGASVVAWLADKPELQSVPRERTGGGVHLHFICRDLPTFRNKSGDPYDKPLVAKITEEVSAELFFDGCNLVVAPSQHASGHTYAWEVGGDIPEVTWAQIKKWFGFVEPDAEKAGKNVGKIKAEKERPWWSKFKGDLRTLDLTALFREASTLGECIDPDKHQWGVKCPWANEHADGGADWSASATDTAIFNPPDQVPGFKCLHAHCDGRDISAVLDWFESQVPGCIDNACRQARVWESGQTNQDGRPRIILPGIDRPESVFAEEIGTALAPLNEWFVKNDTIVTVGVRRFSESVTCLAFKQMPPVAAGTSIEEHVETGIVQTDKETGDKVFRTLTMNRETSGSLLSSPQLKRSLPQIVRILDLPIPIRRPSGAIEFPKIGYDPRFQTYCDPDAPVIRPMPVTEAKALIMRIHQGFCFKDAQSITHALARFITPYCRGLMGWTARFPLWIFNANRPRAGKDYLAGVTALTYEGTTCEDAPLERESEETRKRITAANMAGRRTMHLANCQGHIDDPVLIGAITSHIFSARNLGSTDAKADLRLPNEIEFSISANVGLTFREDVEPRSRKINLHLEIENPNDRSFEIKLLHDYILRNRGEILSSIASLVGAWIDAGCPEGRTPFSSFPQWAAVVGGIMMFHGLGDPCLPHVDDGTEIGGDRVDRAMRALYALCYEKYPDRWIEKQAVYQAVAQAEDNDALGFFGGFADDEAKKTKTRIGMHLKKFDRRELSGIRLELDHSLAKSQSQPVRFIRSDGDDTRSRQTVWRTFMGTLGTHENPENAGVPDVSASNSNTEGHLGHLGHLSQYPEQPEVHANQKNKLKKGERDKIGSQTREAEVPNVPEVSTSKRIHQVITDRTKLADIAALLANEDCISLDIETFGPRKGDGLNPWKGEIRLLQLAGSTTSIFILDLQAIGYELGPLAELIADKTVVGHNLKFDALWLRAKCGLRLPRIFCTLTAARLLAAGTKPGNNLDQCLHRYCGIEPAPDKSSSDWGGMLLTEDQFTYAARDVAHLHMLKGCLDHQLEMNGLDGVARLEMQLLPVVIDMEHAGFAVDHACLREIESSCRSKATEIAETIRGLLDCPTLNLGSPAQLLVALKSKGLEIENTTEETLQRCGEKSIIPKVLEYRGLEKQAQQAASLIDCIAGDGRIHCQFEPTGTATGRFSSKNPNLQNIGRGDLRNCFVAPEGRTLVIADYSQVELRAAAAIAGETRMIEAYRRGDDLHRATAAAVLGKESSAVTKEDRQLAKAVNFGLLYGQSYRGLVRYAATSYGVTMSEEQADAIRRTFFNTYGHLRQWHGESHVQAEKGVPEIRTATGRRRLIPATASEWERFTALVNTPVQGGCADGMKKAIVLLAARLPDCAKIISTVHDELIVEAPESVAGQVKDLLETTMREAMADLFPQVPIEVEAKVCRAWGEK